MSDTQQHQLPPVAPAVPIDSGLVLLRSRQLALQRTKVAAIKRDGLPFYRPHPKQDLFHRSVALRRGAFTGNRFGKSMMGVAEDCAWVRGERPWYPVGDAARTSGIPRHPTKGLIIANDWDKVEEIFTGADGKIWKFLPRSLVKSTSRNHSGTVDTLWLSNGSSLRFDTVKSFLSNPQGSESSDWDFIHIDEPCPEAMWKAQSRGLVDRNGSAWFTLTALREPWITDAFDVNGTFSGVAFHVEGSIFDNPYLTKEAIAVYEASLTEDEKECRLYGKPLHKAGLVYKMFQHDKHVMHKLPTGWSSWVEPPLSWAYYIYIDPHPHQPHMVLFLTVDPFGRKYYYHDIFSKCLIRELCDQIRAVLGPRRLVRVRIDPLAYIEDPVHGTTMADEFRRCGISGEKASKDLTRGILCVQATLASVEGYPLFSPECRRTLWEINRYHWDEETNKPVDVDDHAMECLYRSVLDEPQFVEPQEAAGDVRDIEIVRAEFDLPPVPVFDSAELVLDKESLMLN